MHILCSLVLIGYIFIWDNFPTFCKNIVNVLDLFLFKVTANCKLGVSILSRNVVTCEMVHGFVDGSQSIYNFSKVLFFTLNVLKHFEHAVTAIGEKIRKPESFFGCFFSFNLGDTIHIDYFYSNK